MTDERLYDEMEVMDFETNEAMKEHHRKSRRSKRIAKKKNEKHKMSVNKALGANRTKFCKQINHKQNRKNKTELIYNSTKSDYSLKSILFDIT